MRVNNFSSQSFNGVKYGKNVEPLLETLKPRALNAFESGIKGLKKVADNVGMDVFIDKGSASSPAAFFGPEAESSIEYAKKLITETAEQVSRQITRALNPAAETAVGRLVDELSVGADDAARIALGERGTETVNEIVNATNNNMRSAVRGVVTGIADDATDFITRGASDADSFVVTIRLKGKKGYEKVIDAELPEKAGITGRGKTNTMKKLFRMLTFETKKAGKLDGMRNGFVNM